MLMKARERWNCMNPACGCKKAATKLPDDSILAWLSVQVRRASGSNDARTCRISGVTWTQFAFGRDDRTPRRVVWRGNTALSRFRGGAARGRQ